MTQASADSSLAYDDVPYLSYPHWLTHVAHLATLGRVFGMAPPDFRTARVLELGCAAGGNLIPMAAEYPKARFVGIDLSDVQIGQGRTIIAALGLDNIELRRESITDFAPSNGLFDYIIVHGVLSWVPDEVKAAIFAIIQRNLSPNGLAVVSYNTLPGWNMVQTVRELLIYHCGRFASPAEKVAQGRAILDFILKAQPHPDGPYAAVLRTEIDLLNAMDASYLLHDHLESCNDPLYFHQFMAQARAHGLDYVGDSALESMYVGNHPPQVAEVLAAATDIVEVEQYLDFITNRRFRYSVLCHGNIALTRDVAGERIEEFQFRSRMVHQGELAPGVIPETLAFTGPNGVELTTGNRVASALLLTLEALSAKPVTADRVVAEVGRRHGIEDSAAIRRILHDIGIHLALKGGLLLASDDGRYVVDVSAKPVALAVARVMAAYTARLPTGRHDYIDLDESARKVLIRLDGTNTVADVQRHLEAEISQGSLALQADGQAVSDPDKIRAVVADVVGVTLARFAQLGLLVA